MKKVKSIIPGITFHEPENAQEWFSLNTPWCPLFGYLPLYGSLGPQDEVESKTRDACIEIIRNARSLWDIDPQNEIKEEHRLGWAQNSWPEENSLTYPPKKLTPKKLKSARIIFKGIDAIKTDSLFIQLKDPKNDWYMDYLRERMSSTFAEVRDRVIAIARNRMDIAKEAIDRTIRDSKILAIFAIWISWRVLRAMFLESIEEDRAWIQRQIRIAQFLIGYCSLQELVEARDSQMKGLQKKNLKSIVKEKQVDERVEALKEEGIKRNFYKELLERYPEYCPRGNNRLSRRQFGRFRKGK